MTDEAKAVARRCAEIAAGIVDLSDFRCAELVARMQGGDFGSLSDYEQRSILHWQSMKCSALTIRQTIDCEFREAFNG